MKVYVAAPFGAWKRAQRMNVDLIHDGHEPTASWVAIAQALDGDCGAIPEGDQRRRNNAHLDAHDVKRSDAVVVLVPNDGGTGMWFEAGMAYAWGKRVLFVGPALDRSIFCELSEVYETPEAALMAISGVMAT